MREVAQQVRLGVLDLEAHGFVSTGRQVPNFACQVCLRVSLKELSVLYAVHMQAVTDGILRCFYCTDGASTESAEATESRLSLAHIGFLAFRPLGFGLLTRWLNPDFGFLWFLAFLGVGAWTSGRLG